MRWHLLDVTDGRHDHGHAADHHAHRDDNCQTEEVEKSLNRTQRTKPLSNSRQSHSPMMTLSFLGLRTASGPARTPAPAVAPGWGVFVLGRGAVVLALSDGLFSLFLEASVLLL